MRTLLFTVCLLSVFVASPAGHAHYHALAATPSESAGTTTYTLSLMPGQYSAHDAQGPRTGLMRDDGTTIGSWDNGSWFNSPLHVQADFLWFTSGWMEWSYPINIPANSQPQAVSFTAEISSEASQHSTVWPSDLKLTINGVDVASWTIPGDPGYESYGNDRYGLQKNHLAAGSSQYGWLSTWTVDTTGTYFDYLFTEGDQARTQVSGVTISQLSITPGSTVTVRMSLNYDGATPDGGINVYGATWGDYPYDPTINVIYTPVTPAPTSTVAPSPTPTPTLGPTPGVGGIVKLPPAAIAAESANASEGSGWPVGTYAALTGAAIAILFGAWYARRRWLT